MNEQNGCALGGGGGQIVTFHWIYPASFQECKLTYKEIKSTVKY